MSRIRSILRVAHDERTGSKTWSCSASSHSGYLDPAIYEMGPLMMCLDNVRGKIATSSISAQLNGIVATVTFAPLRLFAHFPEFWGQAAEWGSVSSTVPGSLRRLLARSRQNIFLAASQAILTWKTERPVHQLDYFQDLVLMTLLNPVIELAVGPPISGVIPRPHPCAGPTQASQQRTLSFVKIFCRVPNRWIGTVQIVEPVFG